MGQRGTNSPRQRKINKRKISVQVYVWRTMLCLPDTSCSECPECLWEIDRSAALQTLLPRGLWLGAGCWKKTRGVSSKC